MMRAMKPRLALVLLAACAPSPGPKPETQAPQHGVFVSDLDRSADPCTDFYEFVNGTWRKQNPIPASMQRWSRRWQAGETSKEKLKDILDEVAQKTDWPKASVEQLIGDFYGACMDEARVDQLGIEPLRPLLAAIDEIRNQTDVAKTIVTFHQLQIGAPFGFGGNSDLHTPTEVVAWVTAGGLGMPDRDYYLKAEPRFAEARDKYVAHVAKMFELAGRDATAAKTAADTVMAFETRLAKASLDNVALRDPASLDHRMTLAQLQQLTPAVDWRAFLAAVKVGATPFNVSEPAFMAQVQHELADTPIPDWKAYLAWQLIHASAPVLSKPFVDEQFAFAGKFLAGTEEQKPRWKRCVELTDGLLGEALGKKYVDKYFPPAAKARMQGVVKNLLAAMHDTIEKLDWMGPATKQQAFAKLATFNPKIGYPDKWKDYSSIPIRRDQFFADVVAASHWNAADTDGTIGKPLDRGRWGMTPPTSDAYYNASLNEIVFPAGILQPPAFSLDAVDAVNYGAIGVVIGHEISHGFDDQGAKFDAEGRLHNWWTDDDLKKFQERGQCVVDQFEGYFIEPNIHHNGKLVLGESIGDLGGANLAYRAFQKAQQQARQPTLDGFTPDQQFFIAWGQFRADAIRPETQRLMVQGDPHPIAKYRVIGPLSNMPEFRATFGCKADAPMVRAEDKQCNVW
jgi:endothelin-converting enzyme/putative endopeptidase